MLKAFRNIIVFAILTGLVLSTAHCGSSSTESIEENSAINAITKVSPAVVRLVTEDGYGSGVIIDKEGYVITNYHVIDTVNSVTVTLPDGRQFEGTIIEKDTTRDLAMIKIDSHDLPVVSLGNSSKLMLGQDVIAIGYPLGLKGSATVSKGIVSAFREYASMDYIQTDAAINPGSSGGALITLDGEVIGINVGKWTDIKYEGMTYAIAIDDAKSIIQSSKTSDSHQTSMIPY